MKVVSQSVTCHKKQAFWGIVTGQNRNTGNELLTRARGIARTHTREAKKGLK